MKLGMNAKLYRHKTGTPNTWEEIANVKDLTLNLESGEADVTTRANSGWKATVGTLNEASIEFEMIWDEADVNFAAIQEAYFDKSKTLKLAVMSGDIAVAGSQGLVAVCAITKFSRSEPLAEAMTVSVTCKPTYAAVAPSWEQSPVAA